MTEATIGTPSLQETIIEWMEAAITKATNAITRWQSYVQDIKVDGDEISVTYSSPAQVMLAKIVALTVFATALAMEFMPNLDMRIQHTVDELMRAAARL